MLNGGRTIAERQVDEPRYRSGASREFVKNSADDEHADRRSGTRCSIGSPRPSTRP